MSDERISHRNLIFMQIADEMARRGATRERISRDQLADWLKDSAELLKKLDVQLDADALSLFWQVVDSSGVGVFIAVAGVGAHGAGRALFLKTADGLLECRYRPKTDEYMAGYLEAQARAEGRVVDGDELVRARRERAERWDEETELLGYARGAREDA